jgi:hypothetical protein
VVVKVDFGADKKSCRKDGEMDLKEGKAWVIYLLRSWSEAVPGASFLVDLAVRVDS